MVTRSGMVFPWIIILIIGALIVVAVLVTAVILIVRASSKKSALPPGENPATVRADWTAHLNKRRERYREERERILTMVAEGTITAEEAERLFETLERETSTTDCPHCGGEIRADAVKCKHCQRWLIDDNQTHKRLTRSHNKVLAGVCGGLAEYFDMDPTLVRLLTAVIIFFSGIITGLIVYLIAALIVPERA